MHLFPHAVACSGLSVCVSSGCGGRKRFSPVGDCAKGIPRNLLTTAVVDGKEVAVPMIVPALITADGDG